MPTIKDDIMKWSLGNVLYYPATGEMKVPNMGIGIDGYNKNETTVPPTEKKNEEEEVKDE